jgi:N-acetyl-gamma-glutamyl-phosphate reductase
MSLATVYPGAPEIDLVDPNEVPIDEVDVVFLCLPHTASAPIAVAALEAGARVVDLSADFRLRDANVYREWYESTHPEPELLHEAVYGLTEITRNLMEDARLVANPGCYPTSVLLALYPLVRADAVAGSVIVDAKSGVSGAGRKPKQATHFVEVADNLKPYNIGRVHRHLPEMEQILGRWSDSPPRLIFSPHLLPVPRGLLSTIYVPLRPGWSEPTIRELYAEAYHSEPFVQLLPDGEVATLGHVNNSNRCAIGLTLADGTLIITSAIDNLLKGASGQAVQNMNAMFGLEETSGLV